MEKIAIIGLGKLGSVLAEKFNAVGFEVKSYDKNIPIGNTKNISETVKNGELIFICAPTAANAEIIKEIVKYCPPKALMVSFSKGIDDRGKTAAEILSDYAGRDHLWAVIGGPMIADEIKNNSGKVVAAIGSNDEKIAKIVEVTLRKAGIDAVSNFDPLAISFLGILKNVYSAGMGIVVGLNLAESKKQAFTDTVISEMKIFCEMKNIDSKIVESEAGIGDFLATSSSPNSRNRAMGIEIGKTGKISTRGEAFESAARLISRFSFIKEKMPLLYVIAQIIRGEDDKKTIIKVLR